MDVPAAKSVRITLQILSCGDFVVWQNVIQVLVLTI